MDSSFRQSALDYHAEGQPGKISIEPTKSLSNQRDLTLAYSPGVAAACEEIASDPANAFRYTARGNLVAVVTKIGHVFVLHRRLCIATLRILKFMYTCACCAAGSASRRCAS